MQGKLPEAAFNYEEALTIYMYRDNYFVNGQVLPNWPAREASAKIQRTLADVIDQCRASGIQIKGNPEYLRSSAAIIEANLKQRQ